MVVVVAQTAAIQRSANGRVRRLFLSAGPFRWPLAVARCVRVSYDMHALTAHELSLHINESNQKDGTDGPGPPRSSNLHTETLIHTHTPPSLSLPPSRSLLVWGRRAGWICRD
jgi:hypothetical protein